MKEKLSKCLSKTDIQILLQANNQALPERGGESKVNWSSLFLIELLRSFNVIWKSFNYNVVYFFNLSKIPSYYLLNWVDSEVQVSV